MRGILRTASGIVYGVEVKVVISNKSVNKGGPDLIFEDCMAEPRSQSQIPYMIEEVHNSQT